MDRCENAIGQYHVTLGEGTCNITSLYDNGLQCTPPSLAPLQTGIDIALGTNRYYIVVSHVK